MLVEEDFLGGGRGGEFELFLEAWDLGMVDAFGVVVVFLFGTKLVDFPDVLVEGSGFCIPKTVTTFFLFTVPEILLTHSGMEKITLSRRQIFSFIDHTLLEMV